MSNQNRKRRNPRRSRRIDNKLHIDGILSVNIVKKLSKDSRANTLEIKPTRALKSILISFIVGALFIGFHAQRNTSVTTSPVMSQASSQNSEFERTFPLGNLKKERPDHKHFSSGF